VVKVTLKAQPIPGQPLPVNARNDSALAFEDSAGEGFKIIAREGGAAPGVNGAFYASFLDPIVNDRGDIAFVAPTRRQGLSAKNNAALYLGPSGSLGAVARTGSLRLMLRASLWCAMEQIRLVRPSGRHRWQPGFHRRFEWSWRDRQEQPWTLGIDSTGIMRRLLRTGDLVDGNPVIGYQCARSGPRFARCIARL
jgi:hypothetical protein